MSSLGQAIPGRIAAGKAWRILHALRPHYWLKNLLLLFPAIASHRMRGFSLPVPLLFGFLVFSLVSSSVYLFNDVFDAASDRRHPRKRLRALASGLLAPRSAFAILAALAVAGGAISLAFLPPEFGYWVLLYLGLNIIYTCFAKRIFLVDILFLTTFHLIRIFAGSSLLSIPWSSWMLTFYFLFFFVWAAILKRMIDGPPGNFGVGAAAGAGREVFQNWAVKISGFSCLAVGASYILFSSEAIRLYGHPVWLWLPWFSFSLWFIHFWRDARSGLVRGDPLLWVLLRPGCYLTLACFMGVIYFTGR